MISVSNPTKIKDLQVNGVRRFDTVEIAHRDGSTLNAVIIGGQTDGQPVGFDNYLGWQSKTLLIDVHGDEGCGPTRIGLSFADMTSVTVMP